MKKWSIALSLFLASVSTVPVVHAQSSYYYPSHPFYVGETVVVEVRQGRTTGTIQRIDADGYVVVVTPASFENYQGPISRVLWTLNELDGFTVGDTVVVNVRQGRTTGTLQRIDSDGTVVVVTPGSYDNYQGSISGLLRSESEISVPGSNGGHHGHHPREIRVGQTVVVEVRQGRTTGTVQRIDSDGTVLVVTSGGFDNYQGPVDYVRTILNSLRGFRTGETVAVTVRQGRTTGTLQRIDSDGVVLVTTPGNYDNFQGDISDVRRLLQNLYGFSVGETVVVDVRQGRTTGVIQRIESDGFVVVVTPGSYDNYVGPIDRLVHTSAR
jgi:biotin-(acetyl-CoA carboxylase) ligase